MIERDPEKAKERDARLADMQAELTKAKGQKALIAFRVPGFAEGFVARAGAEVRAAGDVFPQAAVTRNGGDRKEGKFDDVAGRGFMIVARNGDPAATLTPELQAFWKRLGGSMVRVGSGPDGDGLADTEGRYLQLMDEYGCDVIVKRPDYYLFGACATVAELPALIADLRDQLRRSGN